MARTRVALSVRYRTLLDLALILASGVESGVRLCYLLLPENTGVMDELYPKQNLTDWAAKMS